MEGGSIGEIPKDWVQRTTLIELDQEKKSVQGTEGGSIGQIPKEKLEFRGRTVVSGRKKLSSGRRTEGDSIDNNGISLVKPAADLFDFKERGILDWKIR